MTTLHEDANVEEAEQAEASAQVAEVAASEAAPASTASGVTTTTADKCQAASKLQPKEHHLEQQPQHATVSDYKIWRRPDFSFLWYHHAITYIDY